MSSVNLVYSNTGTIGPQDGDIQIALKEGHQPTAEFVKKLRAVLPKEFPGSQFAFLPADMTSQILNFGAPAPIDVQISAGNDNNLPANFKPMRDKMLTRTQGAYLVHC